MSSVWNEITKEDIEKAIKIYNDNPKKYSKYQAKSTFLIYDEQEYPAKAIRRIAYTVHFIEDPDESNFLGGKQTKDFFENLGFSVRYEPKNTPKTSDKVNYWLYLPGNEAKRWNDLLEKGIIGLQFIEIGDLTKYKHKKDITSKFQEVYGGDASHKNDVMAYWDFVNNMKIGDIIFVKKGKNELLGKGVVTSDYIYDTEIDDDFNHIRYVDWKKTGNWRSNDLLPTKTLTNITKYDEFLNNIINLVEYECNDFFSYLNNKGYYFTKEMIENYLLSLKVKPFVILTGNSGTGKTKLAQLFAQYLAEKIDYPDKNYEVVAVGANWTDNRNIIGYYNTLLEKPEKTETYNLIEKASNDLDNPYFLILDEMNLSYVERYFADFLSAIESKESMVLPGSTEKIQLPSNLFIIGTVNVDETTYMFSPKVLDRANVLEFKTVPVIDYMNKNLELNWDSNLDINFLEDPTSHHSFNKILDENTGKYSEDIEIHVLKKKYSDISNSNDLWDNLKKLLNELHTILLKSGFDFGFRVTNEILIFIYEASYYESNMKEFNWERYLDAQILQKILPKLHGSKTILEETLNQLYKFCLRDDFKDENLKFEDINEKNTKFIYSARKIYQMREELDKSRYVSFIG